MRISQIITAISTAFAPYEKMTETVIKGDMLLGPLLDQIKVDRKSGAGLSTDSKSSSSGVKNAEALRKELTWVEEVREVSPKSESYGDKKIAFFGEDSGGGISHIMRARYGDEIYRAKFVRDEVRDGEKRFIIPQAEIHHYLNSLNISGINKGEHFLEVEFADGIREKVILFEDFGEKNTLYDKIIETGDIPEAKALDIILEVSHIISQLHKAGVYHWDIKPAHIQITKEGKIKIFDSDTFFMTKQEFVDRELYITGTSLYRSQKRYLWWASKSFDPERADFSPARDEAYSLGMTLIRMLVSSCVLGPGSPKEWAGGELKAMEETPGISQGLKDILYKAISEGRSDYETVDEFIAAIEEYRRQGDAEPSSPDLSKSSSAGIYWPKVPGPEPENPYYGGEASLEGDFDERDLRAGHDISREIDNRMSQNPFIPVKILILGVGRGFEAFELMKRYGERVDITATNREDLLCREPASIVRKLKERYNDITYQEGKGYIAKLRSQYLRCDLEEELPFEANQYDIVIFGRALTQYIHKKYPAIKEAIRVCKEWGVLYADAAGMQVGNFEDDSYFLAIADDSIIPLPSDPEISLHLLTKFIKTEKLILPEFKEYRCEEYTRYPARAIVYRTYYRQDEIVKTLREDMFIKLCRRLADDTNNFIYGNEQQFRDRNFTVDCLTHCYEFKRRFDKLGLNLKCEIYCSVSAEGVYHAQILIIADNYRYVIDVYPEDSAYFKIEKCGEDFDIKSLGFEISYWPWQLGQIRMWNKLAGELEENYHPNLLPNDKSSSAGQAVPAVELVDEHRAMARIRSSA